VDNCIFCKIVAREIPARVVDETELCIAFQDIAPRQPVHILVVPKSHQSNVAELASAEPETLVDLVKLGAKIAADLTNGSYRFTFNTGAEAGQMVFHAHGHITSTSTKSADA
jgi:histidine triad (HIT) family protein